MRWLSAFGFFVLRFVCRLSLAGLIVGEAVRAASPPVDPDWQVKTWQLHDGLPHNVVCGVARTADGYLWVGTRKDLARFDGVSFEAFPSGHFVAGAETRLSAVIASNTGGLWIAMNSGQFVYLKNGVTNVVDGLLKEQLVENLMEDAQGRLWVGYRQGSAAVIDGGRFVHFPDAAGVLGGDSATFFAQDDRGRVWFGKRGSVGVVEDGQFRVWFQMAEKRSAVAARKRGGLWLCTERALYRVEGDADPVLLADFSLSGMTPTALVEDESGAVWIGTRRHGLFRYHDGGLKSVAMQENRIQSLMADEAGILWVGTRDGGLVQVRPRAVVMEAMESGLSDYALKSLCESMDGELWVTTVEGELFVRRAGQWRNVSSEPDWPGGKALFVAAEPAGGVLIGLHGRVLHRGSDGRFRVWPFFEGIGNRAIHSFFQARSGDWWVAMERPYVLGRVRAGRMQVFGLPEGATGVRSMNEDAEGNLWIATGSSSGGYFLFRFADERLIDESSNVGPGVRSLRFIHRTPDGVLWAGGSGTAIIRIKDGRIAAVDESHGLYEGVGSQMVADDKGWLWLGSDRGLFKVRQQEMNEVADGRRERLSSIVYREAELRHLQGQITYGPGALRTRDGKLWIPMRSGLARIDPSKLPAEDEAPAPSIRQVAVNRQPVARYGGLLPVGDLVDLKHPQSRLRLPPGTDRLEFELTALGGGRPEQARFRCRLHPVDREWVEVGAERVASYVRLSHGHYRFEVQSGGEDGTWHPHTRSLAIVVRPFFWESLPFRLTAGVALAGLGVMAVRFVLLRRMRQKVARLRQQNALHRERARIARDLHDSLGSSLTRIVLLNELALVHQTDPEKAARCAQEVSQAARDVIKSLNHTVWALNPCNDTVDNLFGYLGQVAADFLRAAQVRCRLYLPNTVECRTLPPEARHHILMFVQEALTNVVRHAGAAEVSLRAEIGRDALSLAIEDDGCGFDPAPGVVGNDGLVNMRHRIGELGGVLKVDSTPGVGTRIVATIPWPSAGRVPDKTIF